MLLGLLYLFLLSRGVLNFSSWSVMINLTHQLDRVGSHLEDSVSGMHVGDTFIVLTGVEELFTHPPLTHNCCSGPFLPPDWSRLQKDSLAWGWFCFPFCPQGSSGVPFKIVPAQLLPPKPSSPGTKGTFPHSWPRFPVLSKSTAGPEACLESQTSWLSVWLNFWVPSAPLLHRELSSWGCVRVASLCQKSPPASFLATFSITLRISKALSLFPNKVYFFLFRLLHGLFPEASSSCLQ